MGDHKVNAINEGKIRAEFIRHLLDDITALERMLKEGKIEEGITRIGAEQEFCLVNNNWRPSNKAEEILAALNDSHFTTELAKYNLEINLDPFELTGDAFSKLENQLESLLTNAREVAEQHDNKVVLTGILPTISRNELQFDYMTPNPRYWALNDMMKEVRGSDFELHLRGVDELAIQHDSVLFEACNTSFQMHLQIDPDDFVSSYNWSQAISGPVLGVSVNSPLLLGRELWSETRIALFQQSIDTRSSSYALKDQQARVTFGNRWASGTIADIFKNEIAEYRVILAKEIEKNALEELAAGRTPKLHALSLHNGTIYRWNRPCYGVGGGKAHVRIENRYIPSGPTTLDEMANFAFWVGLMKGRPEEFDHMPSQMDFKDCKSNFIKAARTGKESVMHWQGKEYSLKELVLKELLPIAYKGLENEGIDQADIDRLLDVIAQRTEGQTGAQWKTRNYRLLRKEMKQDDALLALTKATYDNQWNNSPVSEWPMLESAPETHDAAHQLKHIMSTSLYTVNDQDLAELATQVMGWKKVHHVPVENKTGELCGILTWTHMTKYKELGLHHGDQTVSDIMQHDVITASPDSDIKETIAIMKAKEIGCIPVVHDKHLVGIVTIKDLIPFDK